MKKVSLFVFCFLLEALSASESGRLTYRAWVMHSEGKFAKSYSLYEKALLSSRRESNLQAENRILISMALIRIQSLDFAFADSLLNFVRPTDFNAQDTVAFFQARMASNNGQGKFVETLQIGETQAKKKMKRVSDALKGGLYAELAIAYAGLSRTQDTEKALKQTKKYYGSDAPGLYLFTQARTAHLLGKSEADSLYNEAFRIVVQKNVPYESAMILFYRGLLAKDAGLKEKANDFFLRSANAFELLGLPENQKRSLHEMIH